MKTWYVLLCLLLCSGCMKPLPKAEPEEELPAEIPEVLLDGAQLYELINQTILDEKLLDGLAMEPALYQLYPSQTIELLILNQKGIFTWKFPYRDDPSYTIEFNPKTFSYINEGKKHEMQYVITQTNTENLIRINGYHITNLEAVYQDGAVTIRSSENANLPASLLASLKNTLIEEWAANQANVQQAASVLSRISELIQSTPSKYSKEANFEFPQIDTNPVLWKMYEKLGDATCEYERTLLFDKPWHSYINVIQLDTAEFATTAGMVLTESMARGLLALPGVYISANGSQFWNTKTEKLHERSEELHQLIGSLDGYFGVALLSEFAKYQQIVFPDSLPYAMQTGMLAYGGTVKVDHANDYLIYPALDGDGGRRELEEKLLLEVQNKDDLFTVRMIQYQSHGDFIMDHHGNTYYASNCKNSAFQTETVIRKQIEQFHVQEVILKDLGDETYQLLSLQIVD